jgi:hypothetical protein
MELVLDPEAAKAHDAKLEHLGPSREEIGRITSAPVEWKDRSGGRDECHVAGRNGIVVGAVGRSDPDMPWDVVLETSNGPRMGAPAWELDLERAKASLVAALREQDADDVLLRGRRW